MTNFNEITVALPPDHPGYHAFRQSLANLSQSSNRLADLEKESIIINFEVNTDEASKPLLNKLKNNLKNQNIFDYTPALSSFVLREIIFQSINSSQEQERKIAEMVSKMADLIENNGGAYLVDELSKQALAFKKTIDLKSFPNDVKKQDIEAMKSSLMALFHIHSPSLLINNAILAYENKKVSKEFDNAILIYGDTMASYVKSSNFENVYVDHLSLKNVAVNKIVNKLNEISDYFSAKASQADDLSAPGGTSAETPIQRSRSRVRM